MDSFGDFVDGEWESFNKMFSGSDEEFDFPHQFLAQQVSDDQGLHFNFLTPSSTFCTTAVSEATNAALSCNNNSSSSESLFFSAPNSEDDHDQMILDSNNLHINLSQYCSFGSTICSSSVFNVPTSSPKSAAYFFSESMPMAEGKTGQGFPDHDIQHTAASVVVPASDLQLKRKFDVLVTGEDDGVMNSSDYNPKKKPRVPRDNVQQKMNKKSGAQCKKKQNQNVTSPHDQGEDHSLMINGPGSDGQSSTGTCNSEEENASQETVNGESTALNLSGKQRATRGSATDPQSLYARKRRERINERLKILQNLVPNGTKVDISTMLEEAVHYVNFLQLQIKLLSSDDLWMFAPLAYNGIDLCLNQKISSFL